MVRTYERAKGKREQTNTMRAPRRSAIVVFDSARGGSGVEWVRLLRVSLHGARNHIASRRAQGSSSCRVPRQNRRLRPRRSASFVGQVRDKRSVSFPRDSRLYTIGSRPSDVSHQTAKDGPLSWPCYRISSGTMFDVPAHKSSPVILHAGLPDTSLGPAGAGPGEERGCMLAGL
ncbi:hypothetical protein GW17_00014667 [Ensete ventricosum]|nr:hypothetical protein GW17_00014667 [Ensete ventricosum]